MLLNHCVSHFFIDTSNNYEAINLTTNQHISQNKSIESIQSIDLISDCVSDNECIMFSKLCIKEQDSFRIEPFFNITPRAMPMSPHLVFEEEFKTNPWAMLVATVFLTKTSGKTARSYMKEFFDEYPTPYDILSVNPCILERYFETLGLKKRANIIWRLSYQFLSSKWKRASDLFGIGKYGEDAYRMFCLGHTDLEPDDRFLKLYLDWLRINTTVLYDIGVEDSETTFIQDPILKYYQLTI